MTYPARDPVEAALAAAPAPPAGYAGPSPAQPIDTVVVNGIAFGRVEHQDPGQPVTDHLVVAPLRGGQPIGVQYVLDLPVDEVMQIPALVAGVVDELLAATRERAAWAPEDPAPPAPDVYCSGCGVRIFAERADRGRCGPCERANDR